MSVKIYTYGLAAVLFSLTAGLANGQEDNRISCVGLVRGDSVVLRWVPASVPVFQTGIKYGYVVKRYTIARDGVFIPDGLRNGRLLTDAPVKPADNEAFDALALTDERASVVQEAIYGTDFQQSVTGDDFAAFMKAYEELEVRLGFALFMCDMSPAVARAAGLQFTDRHVIKGERYAYSISMANIPDGMNLDPAVIVVDASESTELPPVIDVLAIFTDKAVRFRWPVMLHKGIYSAYIVEKSLNGKAFESVSGLPLVNFSEREDQDYFIYTDSLENNETQVWYRISGISPFGETGPPSEVIKGKGKPEFTAYASIDTAWVNENGRVIIQWRVSESQASPIKEINILRSSTYNGSFIILNRKPLSAGTRTFSDNTPGQSNYYQMMLAGEGDLTSKSFPYFLQTEDNKPPRPPEMLSGKVDSSGVATIFWRENTEPDLLGYKVFRSNSSEGEFIALEQGILQQNLCNDTISINTLTQKIFYQVIAIDRNYNSSDYSPVLGLTRPDTIAPAPAVITSITFADGKVRIVQEGSPSNNVSHYELYRKAEDDSIPEMAATWKKDLPVTFEESPSHQGQNIEYALVTYDHSGNRSATKRKVYVTPSSDLVNLKAEQSPDGKTISIRWELPDGFIPVKTMVYRSMNSDPVALHRTLTLPDNSFIDNNIEINTIYNYRIMVFGKNDNGILSSDRLKFTPDVVNN